jgi:hypothetical protein
VGSGARSSVTRTVVAGHESVARHDLDLGLYLRDVMLKLASGWPHARLDELLPHCWRELHAAAAAQTGASTVADLSRRSPHCATAGGSRPPTTTGGSSAWRECHGGPFRSHLRIRCENRAIEFSHFTRFRSIEFPHITGTACPRPQNRPFLRPRVRRQRGSSAALRSTTTPMGRRSPQDARRSTKGLKKASSASMVSAGRARNPGP